MSWFNITWYYMEHNHYNDVIMAVIASQITSLTIVYSTVYSRADQSSASLAFVWGIHRGPVISPHKWPETRKMFPFDDVIMNAVTKVEDCSNSELPSHPYLALTGELWGGHLLWDIGTRIPVIYLGCTIYHCLQARGWNNLIKNLMTSLIWVVEKYFIELIRFWSQSVDFPHLGAIFDLVKQVKFGVYRDFLYNAYGRNGLKFDVLMYSDHLSNWLHFGHGLLIFLILGTF